MVIRPYTVVLLALSTIITQDVSGLSPDIANSQYAIQWTGLAESCKTALSSLVDNKSDFSVCSGAGKLFDNLVSNSAVDPSTNLIPVAETWLQTDLCASNACTDEVTTTTGLQVHSACSADISKGSFVALVVEGALMNYASARKTLCLYDQGASSNHTAYCPSEVLNNVASSGTPITYDSTKVVLQDPISALEALPTWTYCQACGHGLVTGLVSILDDMDVGWGTAVRKTFRSQCGSGFANGLTPGTLGDGTNTTTAGTSISSGAGKASSPSAASSPAGTATIAKGTGINAAVPTKGPLLRTVLGRLLVITGAALYF